MRNFDISLHAMQHILDYTADGKLVGIEVLNASRSTIEPLKVEYEIA